MRLILSIVTLAATLPVRAETVALQCGDVVDSRAANLVGASTVVVEDARFRELRPGRAIVDGARQIDLPDHTCMPGWIDLHVHLNGQSSPKSYEERFRLDDADISLTRSVAFVMKVGVVY